MNWLFEAGFIAARIQAGLVLLALLFLWATNGGSDLGTGLQIDNEVASASPFLRWSFLAVAALAAVHSRRSVSRTAARVVRVSDHIMGGRARRLQIALAVRLWLATTALAVLTVASAPSQWVRLAATLVPLWLAAFLWSGALSVGVAFFGANAFAAAHSLRWRA